MSMMETVKKVFTEKQVNYVKKAFSDQINHEIRFAEDEIYRETCMGLVPKLEAQAFCYEVGLSEEDFINLFELINQERMDLIQCYC